MEHPAAKEVMPISRTSNKFRAFTSLELVAVTLILAMLGAMVLPRAAAYQSSVRERQFGEALRRIAVYAREEAIIQRHRVQLSYSSADRTLRVSALADTEQLASQSPAAQGANPDNVESLRFRNLQLPNGVQPGSFTLVGRESNSDNWNVTFYPDGTCDNASAVFTATSGNRRLIIRPSGMITVTTGQDAENEPADRWQSGTYEARQS